MGTTTLQKSMHTGVWKKNLTISLGCTYNKTLLSSKMSGPCCCSTNVQAAKVLGIIFAVLSILSCFGDFPDTTKIISGIVWTLISGVLIYGAHTRNSTAILVWMILAAIECIWVIVIAIFAIIGLIGGGAGGGAIFAIIIFAGIIFFLIWTIIVAKNARNEIKDEA